MHMHKLPQTENCKGYGQLTLDSKVVIYWMFVQHINVKCKW